jgi:exopolyphosphatase / guanosine-5'-triphosphate,3'-diphosphate pyrophosphatase
LRRACIDIGSNTTRLLVADCVGSYLQACRQERAFTQIGRSLDHNGAIPEAKLSEVVATVRDQLAIAQELGAEQIQCVATAGVRRARNGDQLVELIASACSGLETRILTGAEEARLAFTGAAWAAGAVSGTLAVVDAGGGSCELAVGEAPLRVRWWESVPLGSSDVTARWLRADPPTGAELAQARAEIQASFATVRPRPAARVIAVGGSATSLRVVAASDNATAAGATAGGGSPSSLPTPEVATIDAQAFERLLETVARLDSVGLAQRFGIDMQRARLLAGGLLILDTVSELFGAPLELGRGGLREGLLLEGYQ